MRAAREALELRRAAKRFAEATDLDEPAAVDHLRHIAPPRGDRSLSEADAYRVAAEAADVLEQFGDHGATRVILTSSWDAGVLPTLAGAPLESVLEIADSVCSRLFPDVWADFAEPDGN